MSDQPHAADRHVIPPVLAGVPHLEQYLGAWAMEETAYRGFVERVKALDLAAHLEARAGGNQRAQEPSYTMMGDGIAVVELIGTMTKYGSSLSSYAGSIALRRILRTAAEDQAVRGILLHVDSPGGSVAGTGDLADDVRRITQNAKPVFAYIEDLGASAAYWVASQTDWIGANPSALVGSIGTYGVIQDWSEFFAREGVKVHVLKAGHYKGTGVPGTEVTDEQLADQQRIVNDVNDIFVAAVARGRTISIKQATELADGRVHVGERAQSIGLVDAIGTFDEAVAKLEQLSESSPARAVAAKTTGNRSIGMSAENTTQIEDPKAADTPEPKSETTPDTSETVAPANYHELAASFPGATPEFLCEQLNRDATIEQATIAFMMAQNARIETLEKEVQKARTVAGRPGVEPHPERGMVGNASGDSAAERWNAALDEYRKAHPNADVHAVIVAVNRANPGLREEYVAESNEQHSA